MKKENIPGFCSHLANLIYAQRHMLRYSQEDCASCIGVAKSTYCRMEKDGFSSASLQQLLLLCDKLDINLVTELSIYNIPEHSNSFMRQVMNEYFKNMIEDLHNFEKFTVVEDSSKYTHE